MRFRELGHSTSPISPYFAAGSSGAIARTEPAPPSSAVCPNPSGTTEHSLGKWDSICCLLRPTPSPLQIRCRSENLWLGQFFEACSVNHHVHCAWAHTRCACMCHVLCSAHRAQRARAHTHTRTHARTHPPTHPPTRTHAHCDATWVVLPITCRHAISVSATGVHWGSAREWCGPWTMYTFRFSRFLGQDWGAAIYGLKTRPPPKIPPPPPLLMIVYLTPGPVR